MKGMVRKFQASNHSLVFLITSPHPEAILEFTKSHGAGIKHNPTTSEIMNFKSPVLRTKLTC